MAGYRLPTFIVLVLAGVAATVASASRDRSPTVRYDCGSQGIPPHVDLRLVEQDLKPVVDFERAVNRYAMMHRQLEGPLPPLRTSQDMRVVREAMDALALAIQTARKDARRGDIFTPEVTRVLQKRIAGCLTPEQWEKILSEQQEGIPLIVSPLQVNGRWPESVPFGFVPPQVLAVLPPLPAELQYRIIGRSLVLWDTHADLIVDIMPGAFTT